MYNDSIETLLLRHYGSNSTIPHMLEEQLVHAVQRTEAEQQRQQRVVRRLCAYRVSRRKAVRLVAIGSAGLGLLSIGMEALELALMGQDATQPALP